MDQQFMMRPVAHIENDYMEKFGIPRQAGLVDKPLSRIILEPEFRNPDVFRGMEGFSHIWLVWVFSQARKDNWSPTVRPPRLGGNERVGVFATRSPFRPNPIGLSCVEIDHIEWHTPEGPVLVVRGADLLNGTPILDIKPYIPYADARPEAKEGFTGSVPKKTLQVEIEEEWYMIYGASLCEEIRDILSQDPRPAYQEDPKRVYGVRYGKYNIRFRVENDTAFVEEIEKEEEKR